MESSEPNTTTVRLPMGSTSAPLAISRRMTQICCTKTRLILSAPHMWRTWAAMQLYWQSKRSKWSCSAGKMRCLQVEAKRKEMVLMSNILISPSLKDQLALSHPTTNLISMGIHRREPPKLKLPKAKPSVTRFIRSRISCVSSSIRHRTVPLIRWASLAESLERNIQLSTNMTSIPLWMAKFSPFKATTTMDTPKNQNSTISWTIEHLVAPVRIWRLRLLRSSRLRRYTREKVYWLVRLQALPL